MTPVSTPLELSAAGIRVMGYMLESNLRVAQAFGRAAIETNPFIGKPPMPGAAQDDFRSARTKVIRAKPVAKKATSAAKVVPAEKPAKVQPIAPVKNATAPKTAAPKAKSAPVKKATAPAPKAAPKAAAPAKKAAPAAKPVVKTAAPAAKAVPAPVAKRTRKPSAPPRCRRLQRKPTPERALAGMHQVQPGLPQLGVFTSNPLT